MSTPNESARPRQLTLAASFVIGASALLVLTAFDSLAKLSSVEKRQDVAEMLSTPPFEGMGLTVGEVLAVTRVGLMVAAACGAAAVVLGIFVLQRHRGARVALSVVAVPLLLSTLVTGDLLGALVAAATLMLWTGPARDWFAGRPVRQVERPGRAEQDERPNPFKTTLPPAVDRPEQHPEQRPEAEGRAGERPTPAVSTLTTTGPSRAPAATSGFGQGPTALAERPSPSWVSPGAAPGTPAPAGVPATVKIACLLTWVFSGAVALMYAAVLAVLVVDSDRLVDFVVSSPEWERAELDPDLVLPMLWIGCLMFLGWALGACVLAFFVWRRHNWARWLLAASAGTAVLAAVFAFPVGLLHQAAAALTIAGLFGAAARDWFVGAPGGSYRPPGPPPGRESGHEPDANAGPYPGSAPTAGPGQDQPARPHHQPDNKPPVW